MNIRADENNILKKTSFVRKDEGIMNRNYSNEHRHAVVIGEVSPDY
jgi:hypothetical protein